jgi:tetratricopeptide (TPR) repeat protein
VQAGKQRYGFQPWPGPGQASAFNNLGYAGRVTGDYAGAAEALEQALDIYRDLGGRLGQANALGQLGVVRRLTGEYPAAAEAMEQALAIYRDLGSRSGEAGTLNASLAFRTWRPLSCNDYSTLWILQASDLRRCSTCGKRG